MAFAAEGDALSLRAAVDDAPFLRASQQTPLGETSSLSRIRLERGLDNPSLGAAAGVRMYLGETLGLWTTSH